MSRTINPAILPDLKDALTKAFWFKKDLKAFLRACLPQDEIVNRLEWSDYKRNIVNSLVDTLVANQPRYLERLIDLMISLSDISDPVWLKEIENGDVRYREAAEALDRLRSKTTPYRKNRSELEEAARRARERSARDAERRAIQIELGQLKTLMGHITSQTPQERGYSLERLLNQLFQILDITSRSSFRIIGEQIDGSFSLDRQDFLLEAKWTNNKIGSAELDTFSAKVGRKLDNTLGLMVSISGYEETAVSLYSQGRSVIILMDGADLYAVLDGRVDLSDLIDRKRRHASQTGEIFFPISKLLAE